MEPENIQPEVTSINETSRLHQVTPLSKYLAMALFIILPFVGGWIGYMYAPEKVVEVVSDTPPSEIEILTANERSDVLPTEIETNTPLIIEQTSFVWNGIEGSIVHECMQINDEKPLLVIAPYYTDDGQVAVSEDVNQDGVFCNQENIVKMLFDGQEYLIDQFDISTTTDYKHLDYVGFAQSEFTWPARPQDTTIDVTKSSRPMDTLLIGVDHQPCDWKGRTVCNWGESVSHIVRFPALEITALPKSIGSLRGMGALKWNGQRTAYAYRTAGNDPIPSLGAFRLDALDTPYSYSYLENLSSPLNPANDTEEERQFRERLWANDEVEWLSEYEVRILDEVIVLE